MMLYSDIVFGIYCTWTFVYKSDRQEHRMPTGMYARQSFAGDFISSDHLSTPPGCGVNVSLDSFEDSKVV